MYVAQLGSLSNVVATVKNYLTSKINNMHTTDKKLMLINKCDSVSVTVFPWDCHSAAAPIQGL